MSKQVTEQQIERLPLLQHALLNKFYQNNGSPMRIKRPAEGWVMRKPNLAIIAGLCLTPITEGYWLTGLFVTAEQRQRGIAQQLIKHIQKAYPESSIWLFCHPDLLTFYQQINFAKAQQLPAALSSRLIRYQQSKKLIALQYVRQY